MRSIWLTRRNGSRTVALVLEAARARVWIILLVSGLMLGTTALALLFPLLFKTLIDAALPAGDTTLIAWLIVGMVGIPLVLSIINALRTHLVVYLGFSVSQRIRTALLDHVLRARITDLEKRKSGELMSRIMGDGARIGDFFVPNQVLPFISNTFTLTATVVTMFILSWDLTLVAVVLSPLSFIASASMGRLAEPLYREFSDTTEEGFSRLDQILEGLRTVRAFNAEDRERAYWRDWARRQWRLFARMDIVMSIRRTLTSDVVTNVAIGLVWSFGAYKVLTGSLTVGTLVAFVVYVPRVHGAYTALIAAHQNAESVKVEIEKLDALFAIPVEQQPGLPPLVARTSPDGVMIPPSIEFRNVTFRFERGFGVEDVSFVVDSGAFVAIVGPSGGGKTTIADLVMGYIVPESGQILVDGQNIQEHSVRSLRERVGYVSQQVFLWNDSIGGNLAYPSAQIGVSLLDRCVRAANLQDFIRSLPEKYETIVNERSTNLSGGEAQRIAIARALVKGPGILLMDEATSALDAIAEARIRQALDNVRGGCTVLVVAHRLSTIMGADRILVFDHGRLVEAGSIEELLSQRGLFAQLYESQSVEPKRFAGTGVRPLVP